MKKFDTIDLEIIPKEEMDKYSSYPEEDVCTFVINGKRALDLINEYHPFTGFSYMFPRELYYEMTNPWCYEDGAKDEAYYPIICCECGITGCNAIGVRIKRKKDVVEWYDISCLDCGGETKIGDFTLRFKAVEYDAVMEKLRRLAGKL